jgi:hypothetical protein
MNEAQGRYFMDARVVSVQGSTRSRRTLIMLTAALMLMALVLSTSSLSVSAMATDRYVDGPFGADVGDCSNPLAPCATIGYAIGQSSDGDTILVADAEYVENLRIDMGGSLTLRGGSIVDGANWTFEPGRHSSINGSRSNTVVDIRDTNVTMEHFVVRNGQGVDDPTFGAGCGGFKIQNADVVLADMIIVGNQAGVGSGGAICSAGDSRLNTLEVLDSIIAANDGHSEAGALNLYHTDAYLENTQITNNRAERAAVLLTYPDPGSDSEIIFRNCTIADNSSSEPGAMILSNPNRVEVWNSIVWGNGDNVEWGGDCNNCIAVRYTDIQFAWTGEGNIAQNPLFVDPGSDYRILPESPCVDAGTNADSPRVSIQRM